MDQSLNLMRGLDQDKLFQQLKMLQELKFFPPLCSTIIGWTMSEEEERMLPFFYLTCPSSLPPGSHRLFVGVYAHC